MENAKLVSFTYITYDGEQQQCEKTILVDAAKVTVIGDKTNWPVLLSDGVLYGTLNLFLIIFGDHQYGSDTMNQANYIAAVNACCAPANQTITFAQPTTPQAHTNAPFAAGATASSGLAVSYASSNNAVATVNASTGVITPVAAGSVNITASQAGNTFYNPATPVVRTIVFT